MKLSIILMTAINAITPILLLTLLGYWLKRIGFLNESFAETGNKVMFNICLPSMLFINVYNIDGLSAIRWDVVIYCVAAVLLLFLLGFFGAMCTKEPLRKGVVMQCFYRSNFAIIGLPIAAALGGAEAEAAAAVISAFTIPFFNVFAVISLTIYRKEPGEKVGIGAVLKKLAKNPLIIGVLSGLLCLGLRQLQNSAFGEVVFSLKEDTGFLYTTLNNLKSVTTPLALLVLGAKFEFSAVKGMFREILVGTTFRLVMAPLLGIGLAVLLTKLGVINCSCYDYPALIALFGSPVAISSAVMASAMKNDGQLAGQLVVWTSLFSVLTIFVTICIMMPLGLLVPAA